MLDCHLQELSRTRLVFFLSFCVRCFLKLWTAEFLLAHMSLHSTPQDFLSFCQTPNTFHTVSTQVTSLTGCSLWTQDAFFCHYEMLDSGLATSAKVLDDSCEDTLMFKADKRPPHRRINTLCIVWWNFVRTVFPLRFFRSWAKLWRPRTSSLNFVLKVSTNSRYSNRNSLVPLSIITCKWMIFFFSPGSAWSGSLFSCAKYVAWGTTWRNLPGFSCCRAKPTSSGNQNWHENRKWFGFHILLIPSALMGLTVWFREEP